MTKNIFNKTNISNEVYFCNVHEERFKTMRISAAIMLPLKKETASDYAMLSQILTRCCKQYPSFTQLSKKLNSLYGASLSGGIKKTGETQVITITLSGIDDAYAINEEKITQELTDILISVIFEPRIENNAFFEDDLEQERRQLLDLVDSEYNDKRAYAVGRALEIMCKNENFGLKRYGTVENINKITTNSLYETWQKMLTEAVFYFSYIGNNDTSYIKKALTEKFEKLNRNAKIVPTEIIKTVGSLKEEKEESEVAQAKLILGFRTTLAEPNDDVSSVILMSAIFGGGANSKLFMNVREKLSLCYYCFSKFDKNKGILIVECGVEKKNIKKVKKAILDELADMKNGIISDFEIDSAKLNVKNNFIAGNDTASGIESFYLNQLLDKSISSPNELIDKINAVSKTDVVKAANLLQQDTVYVLQ